MVEAERGRGGGPRSAAVPRRRNGISA